MLYQGDDLIKLMTITIKASDGILPLIEYVDVRIGGCIQKRYKNPANPFSVNLTREESAKLSVTNKVFVAIWYHTMVDGKDTLVKQTCEGTAIIKTKPGVTCNG